MSALFVSDIHLDAEQTSQFNALDRVLEEASQYGTDIYILGDLVEVWVGDDDDSEFAVKLCQMLRRHGERTSLCFMHGNRDFLLGNKFADRTNGRILEDPTLIDLGGNPVLLSHGDAFCTSDTQYQMLRNHFRSENFKGGFLAQNIEDRRAFAQEMRNQSRKANANKAENITDVVDESVLATLKENNCKTVIHGHTHRPGVHDLGGGSSRWVMGDWERCAWIVKFQDELELSCVAI